MLEALDDFTDENLEALKRMLGVFSGEFIREAADAELIYRQLEREATL